MEFIFLNNHTLELFTNRFYPTNHKQYYQGFFFIAKGTFGFAKGTFGFAKGTFGLEIRESTLKSIMESIFLNNHTLE